jgi:hypothetical protein
MRCKGTTFSVKKNSFAIFFAKKVKKLSFFGVFGQNAPVFILK